MSSMSSALATLTVLLWIFYLVSRLPPIWIVACLLGAVLWNLAERQ